MEITSYECLSSPHKYILSKSSSSWQRPGRRWKRGARSGPEPRFSRGFLHTLCVLLYCTYIKGRPFFFSSGRLKFARTDVLEILSLSSRKCSLCTSACSFFVGTIVWVATDGYVLGHARSSAPHRTMRNLLCRCALHRGSCWLGSI